MRWSRARMWNTVVIVAVAGVAGAAGTASADTAGAWQVVPSANSTANDALSAVTAVSSSDVWAAGTAVASGGTRGLIEHYDGTGWTLAPISGATGSASPTLDGIAASSATSVWAVGATNKSGGSSPLVEHYNGSTWSAAATPTVSGSLAGVESTSPSDVWAVGQTTVGTTPTPLAEHFDGQSWSIATLPTASGGRLAAVAADSPSDVWAVGQTTVNAVPTALVEHYNGTAWSQVSVPAPQGSAGDWWGLGAVSTTASGDVFAVGGLENPATGATHAFVESYDGTSWTATQIPDVDAGGINSLTAVDALSSSDVWAVGNAVTSLTNGTVTPLVEHYDGTGWQVAAAPSNGNTLHLNGLTDTGSGQLWTVGGQTSPSGASSNQQTLTALYQ